MGLVCCDSSTRAQTADEAARSLNSVFAISNKDMIKGGTAEQLEEMYNILDSEA